MSGEEGGRRPSEDEPMLVKNGKLVTPEGVVEGDVRLEGDTIAEIGSDLSGEILLDAEGCWVLPGVVDPHVHISLEGHSTTAPLLDDLQGAGRAALGAGVTTLGVYVQRTPDKSITEMMASLIESQAAVDFFINALLLPGDDIAETVSVGTELGVTTYKAFSAYQKAGLMMDDHQLMHLMSEVATVDGMTLIHAENGGANAFLEERERTAGVSSESLLRAQPGELEAEGMFRTATFARLTGSRLHFVHLSSREGARMLETLKQSPSGDRISCETQPHYLSLTNREVAERGPLAKVGPPLKEDEDVAAVWEAIQAGHVDNLSSDHSPKSKTVKLSAPNILDATYGGIAGIGALFPLTYELGYCQERLGIEDVVRLTASAAAEVYGVAPGKGRLEVGADADLITVPIDGSLEALTPQRINSPADYSLYEPLRARGFPRDVVRRGRLAVRDAKPTGDNTPGRYLSRPR